MPSARPVALALALAVAPAARGGEPPVPLQYNLALDASVTGAMALSTALLAVYQPALAPSTCRWCAPGALDASVRNALVWNHDFRTADVLSSVIDGVLPASAVGYLVLSASGRGDVDAGLVDSLLVTEAVAGALLLNQVVKLLVGRQRPYAFYGHDIRASETEKNLSFYSGHASLAFSVVAATVTVAAMRGYAGTGIAAGVGFTLAAGVGYLRIAADQHYLSDVLVGAAAGGLMGWAVPRIFHSPRAGSAPPAGLRLPPIGWAVAF